MPAKLLFLIPLLPLLCALVNMIFGLLLPRRLPAVFPVLRLHAARPAPLQ